MMLALPPELLVPALAGAAFAGAYLSAAVGIGGGTLFIVLLYLLLPPQVALPLHGAVQVLNNGVRLIAFRKAVVWPIARAFLIPVLPAIGAGWLLLGVLDTDLMVGMLGVYVVFSSLRPPAQSTELKPKQWSGLGALASLSSMLVGAADPVIAPFFANKRYRREEVIATKAICQLSTHIPKVILFVALGQQTFEFNYGAYGVELASMGAAVVVGVFAGKRTNVQDQRFRKIYRGVLLVLGIKLMVDAAMELL